MDFSSPLRPFSCNLCSLAFKGKQFLQRHMAAHSDARNFYCQYCQNTYKYKKGLNRHVKKVHNCSIPDNRKQSMKKFRVEDYLNLEEPEKYTPTTIRDKDTAKEIEILFTWRSSAVKLE